MNFSTEGLEWVLERYEEALENVSQDPGYMLEMLEVSTKRNRFSRVVDIED